MTNDQAENAEYNSQSVLETESATQPIILRPDTSWIKVIQHSFKFIGPAFMVAIGYMDPGNWATDLQAGASYGYSLLFVILISTLMVIVLQYLTVRMGVYLQSDLATLTKKAIVTPWGWIPVYILAEIAIIACDLAEVIGSAIALKLLFNLPIIWGILITSLDVILVLSGIEKKHFRIIEWIIMTLLSIIAICFVIELGYTKPSFNQTMKGFLPNLTLIFTDSQAMFISLGILGATVMPHNLYLHSSVVQNRSELNFDKPSQIKYAMIDTFLALTVAFLVNCAILITAASGLNQYGHKDVTSLEDAYNLFDRTIGRASAAVFAIALLASGQSSTITGTLAGQIVFEGFLDLKIKPWARRLITRCLAILPAIVVVSVAGEDAVNNLLLWSQVVLSIQLPFAMVPLIYITSSTNFMKNDKNPMWITVIGSIIVLVLIGLNITLLVNSF